MLRAPSGSPLSLCLQCGSGIGDRRFAALSCGQVTLRQLVGQAWLPTDLPNLGLRGTDGELFIVPSASGVRSTLRSYDPNIEYAAGSGSDIRIGRDLVLRRTR